MSSPLSSPFPRASGVYMKNRNHIRMMECVLVCPLRLLAPTQLQPTKLESRFVRQVKTCVPFWLKVLRNPTFQVDLCVFARLKIHVPSCDPIRFLTFVFLSMDHNMKMIVPLDSLWLFFTVVFCFVCLSY